MRMLLRETLLQTLLCEDVAARLRGPDFGPLIFLVPFCQSWLFANHRAEIILGHDS